METKLSMTYIKGGQIYSIEEPFLENRSTREPQNYFNTKTVVERLWRRQETAMSGNGLSVRVRKALLQPLRLRENKKKCKLGSNNRILL